MSDFRTWGIFDRIVRVLCSAVLVFLVTFQVTTWADSLPPRLSFTVFDSLREQALQQNVSPTCASVKTSHPRSRKGPNDARCEMLLL